MKDERTRYETGNVQAVLDGDLDAFIEAYLQWRRARNRRNPRTEPLVERQAALVPDRPACRYPRGST